MKNINEILKEDRLPTLDELRELANYEPIIHKCFMMIEAEKVPVQEALITTVYILAQQVNDLRLNLLKYINEEYEKMYNFDDK